LNWQWAKTGGPRSTEELAVFATLIAAGAIDGATYLLASEWAPLAPMWLAPACSLAAYLIS
jgi:hypothetical protein